MKKFFVGGYRVLIDISRTNIPINIGIIPLISPFFIASPATAIPMIAGRIGIIQINPRMQIIEIVIRPICGFQIRLPKNQICLRGASGEG